MKKADEFQVVFDRLKHHLNAKSDADVARGLDVSPQALSAFKKQEKFPSDLLIKYCFMHDLSIDWLLLGTGNYPAQQDQPGVVSEQRADYRDYVFIPRMAGNISAGGGLVPDDTVEMKIAFRRDWIARRGDPEKMSLIRIAGDSMEPTLLSGDLVLVDHGRNYVDPYGGLYAIALDHSIMIKRIQLIHTTGKLRIISDNLRYQPIEADPTEVKVNGKVIWFGREIER